MADSTVTRNGHQRQVGLISLIFSLLGRFITILLISWFFSVLFEWIGMIFFWPEQGVEHSKTMMQTESGYLNAQFTQSLLLANPLRHADTLLAHLHHWLFIDSGFHHWIKQTSHTDRQQWTHLLYVYLAAYIESALYITLTFFIRLILLLLTMPLFLLSLIVGVVDGLVRRDIRRFGSGYESGFVYHHAKRSLGPTFITTWLLYLSLPFSIHPTLILLPAALLFGTAASIMVGMFKKYL